MPTASYYWRNRDAILKKARLRSKDPTVKAKKAAYSKLRMADPAKRARATELQKRDRAKNRHKLRTYNWRAKERKQRWRIQNLGRVRRLAHASYLRRKQAGLLPPRGVKQILYARERYWKTAFTKRKERAKDPQQQKQRRKERHREWRLANRAKVLGYKKKQVMKPDYKAKRKKWDTKGYARHGQVRHARLRIRTIFRQAGLVEIPKDIEALLIPSTIQYLTARKAIIEGRNQ